MSLHSQSIQLICWTVITTLWFSYNMLHSFLQSLQSKDSNSDTKKQCNFLEVAWSARHKAESLRTRFLPKVSSSLAWPLNWHSFPFLASWLSISLYSMQGQESNHIHEWFLVLWDFIFLRIKTICIPPITATSPVPCTLQILKFKWQNTIAFFTLSALSCWESHFTLLEFYLPYLSE